MNWQPTDAEMARLAEWLADKGLALAADMIRAREREISRLRRLAGERPS